MVICTAQKHLQCSGDHVINISYSGYFTHTSEGGGASGLFMYVPVSKCLADISAPVLKCPDGTSSDMSRSIKSLTNVSKGHRPDRTKCLYKLPYRHVLHIKFLYTQGYIAKK